eukprot:gene2078-5137_t
MACPVLHRKRVNDHENPSSPSSPSNSSSASVNGSNTSSDDDGSGDGRQMEFARVEETLTAFVALLPQCKSQIKNLQECRERVAKATPTEKKLWGFGFGRGHCAEESNAYSDNISSVISAKCTSGDHHGLVSAYSSCLKESDDNPGSCTTILADFLACAQKEVESLL